MNISRIKVLGGSVAVVMLVLAAVLTTSAFAAPPTPTPPSNPDGNPGYGMMGAMGGYNLNGVAKLLGLSKQDLVSQLQGGKTLVQIAQGKASEEQLINTLIAPVKDQLQIRVKYEFITQQQADTYLKQITERVKAAINTPLNTESGGTGGCGGSGGMMGTSGGMMGGSNGMMGSSGASYF